MLRRRSDLPAGSPGSRLLLQAYQGHRVSLVTILPEEARQGAERPQETRSSLAAKLRRGKFTLENPGNYG